MTMTIERGADLVEAAERPQGKREIYTAMSGLVIAMLLAMLDNMIVGTAMPTIVGELGGLAHLSWVVTGYALASAVSTPVWAKLGDLYGRRGLFMASIMVFLIGSALAGLAQGMGQLIAFRGIQGLGAGGLMVGAMAIIADLVPLRDRGRYQGLMAAVMPVAFIGGPLLGGLLTDHLSWRWAFYINLPLGVLALVVTALTMRLPARRSRASIDWAGAGLLATGVAALTLLASWGGTEYAWSSAPILGLAGLSALALAVFVIIERRVAEPILPLGLFLSRNFTAAIALIFLTGLAMFGAVTFLPQFQQNVQGASATISGLLLLPLMGGMLTTSLLGGQLVSRTGRYRGLLLAGSAAMAAGLGLLATVGVTTSALTTSLWMIVLGVGLGMLMQTTTLVVQNSVAQRDVGAATGAATMFRTIGGSLGVSLFGTLFAQRLQAGLSGRSGPGAALTPAMLGQLPAPAREAYQQAITSGVELVFRWAALAALLAIVAAWLIREIPLRGGQELAAPPHTVADDAARSLTAEPPMQSTRRDQDLATRRRLAIATGLAGLMVLGGAVSLVALHRDGGSAPAPAQAQGGAAAPMTPATLPQPGPTPVAGPRPGVTSAVPGDQFASRASGGAIESPAAAVSAAHNRDSRNRQETGELRTAGLEPATTAMPPTPRRVLTRWYPLENRTISTSMR